MEEFTKSANSAVPKQASLLQMCNSDCTISSKVRLEKNSKYQPHSKHFGSEKELTITLFFECRDGVNKILPSLLTPWEISSPIHTHAIWAARLLVC